MVRWWFGVLGAVCVAGCGSSVPASSSGGGGGTGSGGETNGHASAATTNTPVLDCEELASAQSVGPAVTISIRNDLDAPAFISPSGCEGNIPMLIENEAGVHSWNRGDCFPETCDGFIDQGDCSISCADCEGSASLRIEPGGTHTFEWSGGLFSEHELPPSCLGGQSCGGTCWRLDQAVDDSYTLQLSAFAACSGPGCECIGPVTDGVCSVEVFPNLVEPLTAVAALEYPSQTSITLALQ